MPMFRLATASLYFELQGQGPLLLFIAGAKGTGTADFKQTAQLLSSSFSVVTYDRRGYSRNPLTGEQDYSHRLERDADDAAELIQHVLSTMTTKPSVYVFGTSSGAIVALTLLCRHHALITKLTAHEPPWHNAFSDDEGRQALAETHQFYELYRAKGAPAALRTFAPTAFTPKEIALLVSHARAASDPYDAGNALYWFERELPVYPFAEAPWDTLGTSEVKKKLVMGVSAEGGHLPAGQNAKKMARKLSPEVALRTFPGGHLPYLTEPEPFSNCIRSILTDQAE